MFMFDSVTQCVNISFCEVCSDGVGDMSIMGLHTHRLKLSMSWLHQSFCGCFSQATNFMTTLDC